MRKILLIAMVAVLVAIGIGAAAVQAKQTMPNLGSVWYATYFEGEMDRWLWNADPDEDPPYDTQIIEFDVIYQQVGDFLFWANNRGIRVFVRGEAENVWVCERLVSVRTSEDMTQVLKIVCTEPVTLTFDEDTITMYHRSDLYRLQENPGGSRHFDWYGLMHLALDGEAPLGKPAKP